MGKLALAQATGAGRARCGMVASEGDETYGFKKPQGRAEFRAQLRAIQKQDRGRMSALKRNAGEMLPGRETSWFYSLLPKAPEGHLATRTRRLPELIRERFEKDPALKDCAEIAAKKVSGFGTKEGKERDPEKDGKFATAQTMFLTTDDVDRVFDVVAKAARDAGSVKKFEGLKAADLQAAARLDATSIGRPRPTRFAVPAGSVYLWRRSSKRAAEPPTLWPELCDKPQDHDLGWGVALSGVWRDGIFKT